MPRLAGLINLHDLKHATREYDHAQWTRPRASRRRRSRMALLSAFSARKGVRLVILERFDLDRFVLILPVSITSCMSRKNGWEKGKHE